MAASSRASSSSTMVLGVLLAAGPAVAQPSSSSAAPAPAPSSSAGSCVTEMVSLYPCLGYISPRSSSASSSTEPSASCCAALSSVVWRPTRGARRRLLARRQRQHHALSLSIYIPRDWFVRLAPAWSRKEASSPHPRACKRELKN